MTAGPAVALAIGSRPVVTPSYEHLCSAADEGASGRQPDFAPDGRRQ